MTASGRRAIVGGEARLGVPMTEHFPFEVSLVDFYDSTPAEDPDRSSFHTQVGLSVRL